MLSLEEKNITQTLILLLYIVYEDAMVEHQDTFFLWNFPTNITTKLFTSL